MKKVLFVVEGLCIGGAERVLVNLLNFIDKTKFDVTLMLLFERGPLVEQLSSDIKIIYGDYKKFRGIKHVLKWFPKRFLHNHYIKNDDYDIEVAYMTGVPTFVVSGSRSKKVAWLHGEFGICSSLYYSHLKSVYDRFDLICGVSKKVCDSFNETIKSKNKAMVVYNTNDIDAIIQKSKQDVDVEIDPNVLSMVSIGCLESSKGYDRLISALLKINFNRKIKLYIIGEGKDHEKLQNQINDLNLQNKVALLGYQSNPYAILKKCDLFICSSRTEGLSTAVTEALILGLPIVSTDVSGAYEILGDSEYGIICENSLEGIIVGVNKMLKNDNMRYYTNKTKERKTKFDVSTTVGEVENILFSIK